MAESGKLIEILLVEDNACDVELTRHFFASAKVRNRLHVVSNGEEALDFIYHRGEFKNSAKPDIVLLDMNLPQKSGHEVIEILRHDPATKNLPIIILTGDDSRDGLGETYDAHANFYITKPLTFISFIHAIQSLEEFWLGLVTLTHDAGDDVLRKKAS